MFSAALIGCGYEQARRAVHVGRQLHGTSAVAHFDDLGAYRLLSLIEDAGELRSFVGEVLHELADEDDPEAADMRATLRAQSSRLRRSDESVKGRRWLGKACRSERSLFDKLGSARRLTPGTAFRHCGCR